MDTYGHKPSNDELLHDLLRLFGPEPVFAGAGVTFKTDEERMRLSGPLERVMVAVDEYHGEVANQAGLDSSPDGDAYMSMYADLEHQAWLDMCAELRVLKIDINEHDKLTHLLHHWGELLAQLRYNQGPKTSRDALTKAQERLAE